MTQKGILWTKAKRWLRAWWTVTAEDTLAPIVDANARLNVIAIIILLAILLPPKGYEVWSKQVISTRDSLLPFLLAFPIFVAINAVLGIFKTSKFLRERGEWFGPRYVYHSPVHLLTLRVSHLDNDTLHAFKLSDVEADSLAEIIVEIDRSDSRVKAQVVHEHGKTSLPWEWIQPTTRTSLRVSKSKRLVLRTNAATEATMTTIRVYVASWEVGDAPYR